MAIISCSRKVAKFPPPKMQILWQCRTFSKDAHSSFFFPVKEHARPGPVVTSQLPSVTGRPLSVNCQPLADTVHFVA